MSLVSHILGSRNPLVFPVPAVHSLTRPFLIHALSTSTHLHTSGHSQPWVPVTAEHASILLKVHRRPHILYNDNFCLTNYCTLWNKFSQKFKLCSNPLMMPLEYGDRLLRFQLILYLNVEVMKSLRNGWRDWRKLHFYLPLNTQNVNPFVFLSVL